jgi:hypothetical protein
LYFSKKEGVKIVFLYFSKKEGVKIVFLYFSKNEEVKIVCLYFSKNEEVKRGGFGLSKTSLTHSFLLKYNMYQYRKVTGHVFVC